MFATLVVCLPSKHEGGEVVLRFSDKTTRWSSSTSSAFDISFAAWYVWIQLALMVAEVNLTAGMRM